VREMRLSARNEVFSNRDIQASFGRKVRTPAKSASFARSIPEVEITNAKVWQRGKIRSLKANLTIFSVDQHSGLGP
jgi:hypothetical protein